jgi:hypothetical protein
MYQNLSVLLLVLIVTSVFLVVVSHNIAYGETVINLSGKWEVNKSILQISVQSSSTITFPWGDATAFGLILNPSTISVTFPSDKTLTGKLEPPDTIRWSDSKGTVWTKIFDMERIEGRWIPEGGPENKQAEISIELSTIKELSSIEIDMMDFGRPTAHGKIISHSINDPLISVNFPDDRTYTGNVKEADKIHWSNGSVWTKIFLEG